MSMLRIQQEARKCNWISFLMDIINNDDENNICFFQLFNYLFNSTELKNEIGMRLKVLLYLFEFLIVCCGVKKSRKVGMTREAVWKLPNLVHTVSKKKYWFNARMRLLMSLCQVHANLCKPRERDLKEIKEIFYVHIFFLRGAFNLKF